MTGTEDMIGARDMIMTGVIGITMTGTENMKKGDKTCVSGKLVKLKS
ncbi:MAG: hypothetical protein PHZ02_08140 [Desulfocapsaceae bacterium]|nr:hypothetical protein [Desulfocapsaceae bacterium]